MTEEVSAWVEKIIIPTYETGAPEKNPAFLEKRVYQGSSGVVYPHPVIEKIMDEKINKEYTAVFIENKFLKIMVLPELGGRIHRAFDKVRQRDFIYYNQVIKPALVGLTGPWISGGIEFNWPQHHRPTTFEAVDYCIANNKDGSKTIWVNEVEMMSRTKGMAGFTLYPGKAYLEVNGRIFNRSPLPQTFLWWANPAVKVNDQYRSVFPPDVHAVFDHGKRDVSDFPIATGEYYKVNYAPGTDISRYSNIPVPTSFMAVESNYDFIGCYENDTATGMLHVADHHFSPGKKQWTWGNSSFGQAWDANLTDEDGPYIELMCGVYTDNQPDFSWLQPNEEKTFEQYFFPYAGIGIIKNATREAAVNLEVKDGMVHYSVYATADYPDAIIRLSVSRIKIAEVVCDLDPSGFYEGTVTPEKSIVLHELKLEVFDRNGCLLVAYQPDETVSRTIPQPAVAARDPADISSIELLYLNGLHLEQYRHATYHPEDYYQEGLRRDSSDTRCNNAMGLWYMRRAQPEKAEPYLKAALHTQTLRNPNPSDGEVCYNLGVCLQMLGLPDKAYDSFYKSTWNDAWQHSGFFQLARIACLRHDMTKALYLIDKSLLRNYNSHSARHLKVAVLRHLERPAEAEEWIKLSLLIDPLNFGCLFEAHLLAVKKNRSEESAQSLQQLNSLIRNAFNNYAEYALDYAHAGLYQEAITLLLLYKENNRNTRIHPMCYYYLGWLHIKINQEAADYFNLGANAVPDYCFPSKTEEVIILQTAIQYNKSDSKAYYYLGNYWYANAAFEEAIHCWEQSVLLDESFPTAYRNLSLAYYNKQQDATKSLSCLTTAFNLNPEDGRVLMELDQLCKLQNSSHWNRLQLLEEHPDLVSYRDDLYLERITLYNLLGDFETAAALLSERTFHPWEGGEGKTVSQYLICYTELAKEHIISGDFERSLEFLDTASAYPDNLGEGQLPGTIHNDLHYLQGFSYEGLSRKAESQQAYWAATKGDSKPVQAFFYNDPQPDQIFYQGMAWIKLGDPQKGEQLFQSLINFGALHYADPIRIDYFAVSLPDLLVFDKDLNMKNRNHCDYMIGLGHLGLGNYEKAEAHFQQLLKEDNSHQGAITHLNMITFLSKQ